MPVTLSNPNRVQMPSWLTSTGNTDSLKQFQSQLPDLFSTSGLEKANNQYNDAFGARYEANAGAAANALVNRQMQSGGQVGADFAKGQAMLGLYDRQAGNQLDYAKLAAQMMAQRAGLQGQAAGQLGSLGQQHQGLLADWTQGQQQLGLSAQNSNQQNAQFRASLAQQAAMEQARLAQGNRQFNVGVGMQNRTYNDQQNDLLYNRQQAQSSGRSPFGNFTPGYIPNSGPIRAGSGYYGASGNDASLVWDAVDPSNNPANPAHRVSLGADKSLRDFRNSLM